MEITRVVETSTSLERVYAYLSDFLATNEWDPATVEAVRVAGDGGVGTRYRHVSRFMGRKVELTYVVREVVPQSRVVFQGDNRTLRAVDTMAFEALGTGTRLTYHVEFSFKGPMKYAAFALYPALALGFKKLGDDGERGLRTALDRL